MKKTSKAFKMIEKFDKQLRDVLTAELNAINSTKSNIIASLKPSNGGLQVV